MGLFDHFPYTNVHELNLDWVLSMMKALEAEWEAFTAGNSLTFADPMLHDITKTYAKNTIVLDSNGNAYVSLQAVPVGVTLDNNQYWLMVFDYEAFLERVNKNFTVRYYRDQYRATAAIAIGDWLTVDDILYKATAAIAVDDILEDGVNITHFTLEDFIKAFMQSATQLIQQYKNDIDASELQYKYDIDASELQYRNQLAQDIADTTNSLQAQLNAAIAGVTVDSEVINARVGDGFDSKTYSTLGDAIRDQFNLSHIADNSIYEIFEDLIENYKHIYSLHAINGDINSSTGVIETNALRLVTDGFYFIPEGATFSYDIPNTYRTRFYWYNGDNGTYAGASAGNIYGTGTLTPTGNFFRFIVVRADGVAADPSEISNIKISVFIPDVIKNNYINNVATAQILSMLADTNYYYSPELEIGGVSDTTGANTSETSRMRTVDLQPIPENCVLHISTDSSDYKMRFYWYSDLSGTYVGASAVNLTGDIVVERQGAYFRYIIYNANVQPPVDYDQHVSVYFNYSGIAALIGKKISILGDSITTYGGSVSDPNDSRYSPAGNKYTYPGNRCRYPQTSLGVTDPNQTFWMQLINKFGLELDINDSWAGSKVSWDGHTESTDIGANKYIGSQTRIDHLNDYGTPDIVLINGGTNDIFGNVPLGNVDYTDPSEIVDYTALPTYPFADAYRTMLVRIMNTYPTARIVCILPNYATYDIEKTDKYCEVIKEYCDMYGLMYIDPRAMGITPYNKATYLGDGVHYNATGMDFIAYGMINRFHDNFVV